MAVPVLHLNLAPRPSLWRQRHLALGWFALAAGTLVLAGAVGFTWHAYRQANLAGHDAVSLTQETRRAVQQEQQLQASLQEMDATREQSRWKLAERILQERSLPWSRLTSEIEQCMVPDMRLKSLQRARSNAQQVVMKLKGEARTRPAEAAFVEALRSTPVFAQVILEREAERTGGGWEFEISLPAVAVPPPFVVKAIKQGPAATVPAPASIPGRPSAPPPGRPPTAPVRTQTPTAATMATAPGPSPARPPQPPTVQIQSDGEEVTGRVRRPGRVRPPDPRNPQ